MISSPLWAVGRGSVYPVDRLRYADPATEGEVFRITSPKFTSLLPPGGHHCVANRGNFLIYASDRGGDGLQVFRQDLKSNEPRQLTGESAPVAPWSLAMTADERQVFYVTGATVRSVAPSGGRERDCYTSAAPLTAFAPTTDGLYGAVATADQLLLVPLAAAKTAGPKVLATGPVASPQPRPRRDSVLYRNGAQWFLAHFDGTVNRALKPLDGAHTAQWSADGRVIAFLRGAMLIELDPDTGAERAVGRTSQFAEFARNADGTVFAGLSGSVAQPHVLLLLRITKRERTIAEHKASSVAAPFFSPNSQRLFYQSDRDGKPALYYVALDKLVEKTDDASA